MRRDSQNCHKRQQSRSSKTLVPNNVVDRWSSPVRPSRNKVEERHRNCPGGCTSEHHVPPTRPCSSSIALEFLWQLSHLRPRQSRQEFCCLCGPSPAHLCTKNDQSGSTTLTGELRIGSFLPSPRHLQSFPVRVGSPSPSSAVPMERRHHCGVNCELGTSMQWKRVSNDFQPPPVQPVGLCKVHVANKHVQTNTCSAFPANPCCRRLQRPTSTPEHPCCCASCTVVAKGVEWTATPAAANREGKGQSKSSKEQHTERRRVNPRQPTRWKRDERAAC